MAKKGKRKQKKSEIVVVAPDTAAKSPPPQPLQSSENEDLVDYHETMTQLVRLLGAKVQMLNTPRNLVNTCIPLLDAEGRSTACCIWPELDKAIRAQPSFSKAVFSPAEPSYHLDHIDEQKGMGMFATCSIATGQLILSERPLAIVPLKTNMVVKADGPGPLTVKVKAQVNGPELEDMIQATIVRMAPEDQESYVSLMNSHLHDGMPPLLGRWCTNCLEVDGLHELLPNLPRDEEHELTCVCETLSRVNHSCSPNMRHQFDSISFAMELRAVRDIPAGTELTINYCDVFLPAAERQKALEPYGFTCTCSACGDPSVSDQRRAQIQTIPELTDGYDLDPWLTDHSLPDDYLLQQQLEYQALIEEEGLEICESYRTVLVKLHLIHAALGDVETYKEYTLKAARAYRTHGSSALPMVSLLMANAIKPSACVHWEKRVKPNGQGVVYH